MVKASFPSSSCQSPSDLIVPPEAYNQSKKGGHNSFLEAWVFTHAGNLTISAGLSFLATGYTPNLILFSSKPLHSYLF